MRGYFGRVPVIMMMALVIFVASAAAGEELTVKGVVKEIDLNTNMVIIGTYLCQDMTVMVEEETILKKLKNNLIRKGDDIICRYVVQGERNKATYLSKEKG